MEPLLAEAYRLRLARSLEEQLRLCGYQRVAGVDEVGRGCLAGPVVAAAVVVDPERSVPWVDDSKRLSPELRRHLAALVRRSSIACSVASVPPGTIDRINILEASKQAMLEALGALPAPPDAGLVDAVVLRGLPYPCLPIVRGDAMSYAVACASIVAKVERDAMMVDLDATYPQYGFARHKGYASSEHLEALREYGPCPAHRVTFGSVLPRSEPPAREAAAGRGAG